MAVTEIKRNKQYIIQKGTEAHGFPLGTIVDVIIEATKKESFAYVEDENGRGAFVIKADVNEKKY